MGILNYFDILLCFVPFAADPGTRVVFLAAPGGLMVMGIDMSKGKEVKVKCGIPGETFVFWRLLDLDPSLAEVGACRI